MSGRYLAASSSIHKMKTLHTASQAVLCSTGVFWVYHSCDFSLLQEYNHCRNSCTCMGFISNHPFTFGQTEVSFTQETRCFSLASPEKTAGCLTFPTIWIVDGVSAKNLPTWVVLCMSARIHDSVCFFCIAWLDAAVQNLSTSVQCWYQGIVAATAAAAAAASPTSPNWPRHNQIHLVVFSYLSERGHQVQTLWGRWWVRGGGNWGEEKKGKPLILTRSQTSSSHCLIHTHILLPQHTAQVGGKWGGRLQSEGVKRIYHRTTEACLHSGGCQCQRVEWGSEAGFLRQITIVHLQICRKGWTATEKRVALCGDALSLCFSLA